MIYCIKCFLEVMVDSASKKIFVKSISCFFSNFYYCITYWMVISEAKLIVTKSIVLFKKHIEPVMEHFSDYFTNVRQYRYWSIVSYFRFPTFFVYRKDFPTFRIDVDFHWKNVGFIKSVTGSVKGFLDC